MAIDPVPPEPPATKPPMVDCAVEGYIHSLLGVAVRVLLHRPDHGARLRLDPAVARVEDAARTARVEY
ncbi:hypothetical protein GCM10025876_02250 [Demequina litorisediminis]|uniref:Uncharacterized protein n=1 Tax=Demequina litorisediminis TaxID=1849022 RepID=A0ABQ6I9U2_9MICO|nr:hypothetical protein GCM10025876_02250 [Demequina litorisediminis]